MYTITENQMAALKLEVNDIYVTNAGYNKWQKERILRILEEIQKKQILGGENQMYRIGSSLVGELEYIEWLEDELEIYARKYEPKDDYASMESESRKKQLVIEVVIMNRERRKGGR